MFSLPAPMLFWDRSPEPEAQARDFSHQPEAPARDLPALDHAIGAEKEFDILVVTRKVGESILVPAHGLTIQVGSVGHDQVSLRITVPAETKVFRMGAVMSPEEAAEQST